MIHNVTDLVNFALELCEIGMLVFTYDTKVVVTIRQHAAYLSFPILLLNASGQIVFDFGLSRAVDCFGR